MARLVLVNTGNIDIPGLGASKPLNELSEKRITKAVREALREHFGFDNVEVSCSAVLRGSIWTGSCLIDGEKSSYRLMRDLYS